MRIFARYLGDHGADTNNTDLGKPFDVVVGAHATAPGAIRVSVRDGWVEISTGDGSRLVIEPNAANSIRIKTPEAK